MNEIEKLYENAGVNKIFKYYECSYGTSSIQVCPIPLGDCIGVCDRKSIWDYPSFTAEKQIELIKWLARSKNGIGIDLFGLGNPQVKTVWDIGVEFQWEDYNHTFEHKDFDQALAGLINSLWQDLTEEERKQIKEILE